MADQVRLPLSIFERYMLRDHSAEYPMLQWMQMEFLGGLNTDRLEKALEFAILRHPLLSAPIEGSGKHAKWVLSTGFSKPVKVNLVQSMSEIGASIASLFDPMEGRHLACWHLPTEQGTKLILCVNHIACDGIGCLQFVADWLTAYSELFHGRPVPIPETTELIAELPRREAPGWRMSDQVVTRWEAFRSFVRETWNWYSRKPRVIYAPNRREPAGAGQELFDHTLSIHETRGLRYAAQAGGATLNDLLLCEIMCHVARWNERHGVNRECDWLRILMPTSLRNKQDKSLSAVNRLGYTFLTHRASECDNPERLLKALTLETAAIRQWNLGQMFLDGLAVAEKIPGLWALFTRSKSCLATTVYSSIGEVMRRCSETLPREGKRIRVGEALLGRIYGNPPLRPGTRAVILSSVFCDQMTLSGMTDSRYFDEALRQDWWESLLSQLRETAEAGWRMKAGQNA